MRPVNYLLLRIESTTCGPKTEAQFIDEIEKTKNLFMESFALLRSGISDDQELVKLNREIFDLANLGMEKFDENVKDFIGLTSDVMSSDLSVRTGAVSELNKLSEPLLIELDLLVEAYAQEESDIAGYLTRLQYFILFLLAIAIPITVIRILRPLDKDLRKSLAELKKQKNFMQSVIGLIPDALLVMKADGDILVTNKATEKIFGWRKKELLKMNVSRLLSPDLKEKHAKVIHGFIENSNPDNLRGMFQARPVTGVTKTGENIKVSVSLARYDTPEENLGIAVIRDMTILERLNEALEEHLATARLAKESKDRFVRTISHELRTPLNAVIGFSELLKMNLKSEGNLDYAGYISEAGNQLLEKINQLIDAASLKSEKPMVNITKVLLADYIEGMKDIWLERLDRKKHNLEIKKISPDILVNMDRDIFLYIMDVILDNVESHCAEGRKVKIYMDGENSDPCLVVEDDGHGISEEHISLIGDPFEIKGDGLTTQKGGLALSLFLAKQQMKAIGGQILFQSKEGRGLKVKLYLQAAAT